MKFALVTLLFSASCLLTSFGSELSPERLEWLRDEIRRHDKLYYLDGQPEISDLEYDRLRNELELAEATKPGIGLLADTPTETHPHRVPMLSLVKAKEIPELEDFHAKCARILGTEQLEYWIEPKVDGVAISAVYEDGLLTRVLTRGDGERGNDVGEKLVHSGCLPARLQEDVPAYVELRGEAYIPKDDFKRINASRRERNLPLYSNPRNLATGTLMSGDEDVIIGRGLRTVFFGWGAWEDGGGLPPDYTEFRDWLLANRLPVLEEGNLARGLAEMLESVSILQGESEDWAFDADGLVVKLNSTEERLCLGASADGPNWAVAWKFPPKAAESVITAIIWQMGRTGKLTPVAEFEPIIINGRTIRRASLHNLSTIRERGLTTGERVRIELAGDVIPAVYPISGDEVFDAAVVPDICPWCDEELNEKPGGSILLCPNTNCPERVKRQLAYFFETLGIRGITMAQVEDLVDRGTISGLWDVFSIPENGGNEFLATALAETIQLPVWRRIQSLGLPGIGKSSARQIATDFLSIEEWMASAGGELAPEMRRLVSVAAEYWK